MPAYQNPLGPPTVTGTVLSVDVMLNQPTYVTRFLLDITLQKFAFEQFFSNAGSVSGGAVAYEQMDTNWLYPTNMPEQIAPGAEFPILADARQVPKLAPVAKWGGKIFITDEARDRNNAALLQRGLRKMANGMIRTMDTIAMAAINAQVVALPAISMVGHSWSAVIVAGSTPTVIRSWPAADIAVAVNQFDIDELGETPSAIVLNPLDNIQLALIYGEQGRDQMLASFGLTPFVTNRAIAGSAFILSKGNVGEYRVEKPLGTETWREPETERTWVQTGTRNVFYVTNPYAIKKITGIA